MDSPSDAVVRQQVGAALRAGDTVEAERLLRARIEHAPRDVDALSALGDIVARKGDLAEATALFHRAVELAPGAHAVRLHLSELHAKQSHFPMALSLLRHVPPEHRRSFDIRAREAALLGQVGRRDEEITLYRELVAEQPNNAGLWMTLGTALNYVGKRDDAVGALRRAIELKPEFGEPWWSLANLKSFRFDERDIAAMEAALDGELRPIDALHFHFALGRAFEERSEHERSFEHYSEGNRLRAESLTPAQMFVTPFIDAQIATFTGALLQHYKDAGCADEGPIFVIGLQRSGSTLIEQILASHPDIEGTAELMTMQNLWDELAALGSRNRRSVFEQIAHCDPSIFRKLGEEYLLRTMAYRIEGKRFFVDKLPANWMNVGLIRLALPKAKIIDARRHPMACGFSNFKQHYATGVTFAYSQESIGRFYSDYLRLMRHFDAVQPGAIHHVINERLIDDPEGEVRRMLQYVGVPFDQACLNFHSSKRAVHTPSAEQVRRPINREGVDAWRNYEPWLGPLRETLGQSLENWQS